MLNHIVIMGRMTTDPELRRTNSGKPVTSFAVAVDRDFAPDGGERETDFIEVVAWNGTAEFVEKYFRKGSMIVVSGRLQIRSWTDKDDNKRKTAEVVANNVYFGESKKSQEGSSATVAQNAYPGGLSAAAGYQNTPAQNFGGYQQGYPGAPAPSMPSYNQQGFAGYQQSGYPAQNYQPPQGRYAVIEGDDANLPF